MLTGLHPASHGADRLLRVLPDSAHTLAERLAEQGYATAAVVSHYLIGPRFGFDQGFRDLRPRVGARPREVLDPRRPRPAERSCSPASPPSDTPFFLFLHYFDPHYSYERHARYGFAASGGAGRSAEESRWRSCGLSHHRRTRASVASCATSTTRKCDSPTRASAPCCARSIASDSATTRSSSSWPITERSSTSGAGSATREPFTEELVRVPLILRVPGAGPAVVRESVSLAGLMPTLLDLLGQSAGRAEDDQAGSFAALVRGERALGAPADLSGDRVLPGARPTARSPGRATSSVGTRSSSEISSSSKTG